MKLLVCIPSTSVTEQFEAGQQEQYRELLAAVGPYHSDQAVYLQQKQHQAFSSLRYMVHQSAVCRFTG